MKWDITHNLHYHEYQRSGRKCKFDLLTHSVQLTKMTSSFPWGDSTVSQDALINMELSSLPESFVARLRAIRTRWWWDGGGELGLLTMTVMTCSCDRTLWGPVKSVSCSVRKPLTNIERVWVCRKRTARHFVGSCIVIRSLVWRRNRVWKSSYNIDKVVTWFALVISAWPNYYTFLLWLAISFWSLRSKWREKLPCGIMAQPKFNITIPQKTE